MFKYKNHIKFLNAFMTIMFTIYTIGSIKQQDYNWAVAQGSFAVGNALSYSYLNKERSEEVHILNNRMNLENKIEEVRN